MDQEALCRDAGLAVVLHAGFYRLLRGLLQRSVGQNDERIAAAELKHAGLELAPGCGADRAAHGDAAGEGDGGNAGIGDQSSRRVAFEREVLETALLKTGAPDKILQRRGALRHVLGVLEQPDIARHERRSGEANDLPEWIIPRHDGEHRAERLIPNPAAPVRVGRRFIGQQLLRLFGEVTAGRGALPCLVEGLLDRLAHFQRHQPAQALVFGLEQPGKAEHLFPALRQGGLTMPLKRGDGPRQLRVELGRSEGGKGPHHFAGGGVDGCERHGSTFGPGAGAVKSVSCRGGL